MIPIDPRFHRAEVLPDGSIVLPSLEESFEHVALSEDPLPLASVLSPQVEEPWSIGRAEWTITEPEDSNPKQTETCAKQRTMQLPDVRSVIDALKSGQLSALRYALSMLEEGKEQYESGAREVVTALRKGRWDLRDAASHTWAFLTQPVWIVRRNREAKRYNRGTLFLLDTVRFGGTFAALFTALFITLNYQSFWTIVGSQIRPIQSAQNSTALVASIDDALRDKVQRSPSLAVAGRTAGNMLGYLPDVGPPDNRIIIPKLNLNVPLVTPSFQNLLAENWAGVEEDIQAGLQHGVVHYPGTARPGQAGNFFVTGHSSYYPWAPGRYKSVFARLSELTVGDEYWVYYGGDKHRYIVRKKEEVKPSNVNVLDQPLDRRMATLMTCTPVGTTLNRLIILAEEIDPLTGMALKIGEKSRGSMPRLNVEQLPI